jgi:hypothetical protein
VPLADHLSVGAATGWAFLFFVFKKGKDFLAIVAPKPIGLQRIERGIDQGPARAARRYGVVQSVAHDRSFRAALFAGERLFESFPHNQADRLIAGLQGDIVLDVPLQNIDL